jgi:hypothetical protein
MSDIGKGIALMVLVAIAVLFIYCFFFGKCSKNPFGVLTPRPSGSGSGSGRRRGGSDNLEAEGSGSGGAGAGGSGEGGGIIAELTSRFKDIDVTKGVAQKGGQKGSSGCGFWDLGCKLGDAWKNITEGKTIFGAATPFPAIRGAPLLVP